MTLTEDKILKIVSAASSTIVMTFPADAAARQWIKDLPPTEGYFDPIDGLNKIRDLTLDQITDMCHNEIKKWRDSSLYGLVPLPHHLRFSGNNQPDYRDPIKRTTSLSITVNDQELRDYGSLDMLVESKLRELYYYAMDRLKHRYEGQHQKKG